MTTLPTRVWRVCTTFTQSHLHTIRAGSQGEAIRIAMEMAIESDDGVMGDPEWHESNAYPLQDYDGEWYGEEVEVDNE